MKRYFAACSVALLLPWVSSHAGASSQVYFSDNEMILRYGVTGVDTVHIGEATDHYHWLDVDERNRRLYFAGGCVNCETTYIRWADIEGSNWSYVFEDDITVAYRGVALHPWQDRIYWGFRDLDGRCSIRRSQRDGSSIENVVDSAGPNLWGIALDTVAGHVFWTTSVDSMPQTGAIRRAGINGENVEDFITGLERPASVVVDVGGGKIYWTDYDARKIQRANLWNGGNVETLVSTRDHPWGIDLDVGEGKLYWTAGETLQRCNLDGSGQEILVTGHWPQALKVSSRYPTAIQNHPRGMSLRVSTGPRRTATFWLELSRSSPVVVDLFSASGRRVQQLGYDLLSEGEHEIIWDGRDRVGRPVPNGVYFYNLQADRQSSAGRFLLLE